MAKFFNTSALRSVRSFLIQPTVKVEINGKKSVPFDNADRGYGQGSCLSCTMFLILMTQSHDLTKTSRNFSYADMENVISEANKAAQAFADMCSDLNIKVNYKKSFFNIMKMDRSNNKMNC